MADNDLQNKNSEISTQRFFARRNLRIDLIGWHIYILIFVMFCFLLPLPDANRYIAFPIDVVAFNLTFWPINFSFLSFLKGRRIATLEKLQTNHASAIERPSRQLTTVEINIISNILFIFLIQISISTFDPNHTSFSLVLVLSAFFVFQILTFIVWAAMIIIKLTQRTQYQPSDGVTEFLLMLVSRQVYLPWVTDYLQIIFKIVER